MKLKLSETARVDILASLDHQEAKFKALLKTHNESKSFAKKSLYYGIQGFDVKAISISHAHKKVKALLMQAGFHPDVTIDDMVRWRTELNIKDTEDGNEETKEGSGTV